MTAIEYLSLQPSTETNHVPGKYPVCLTIAGSDPSGGAGIEADLKTFASHQVYGATCITGLTAQNTSRVTGIHKTPKEHLKNILLLVFEDFLEPVHNVSLKTIKTGMMTEESVEVLNEFLGYLESRKVKIVVDPVLLSTSGYTLLAESLIQGDSYNSLLLRAFVLTPNFLEAIALFKVKSGKEVEEITSIDELCRFAIKLQNHIGCQNILLKGGHIPWTSTGERADMSSESVKSAANDLEVKDILYQSDADKITVFTSKYVRTSNSHGTGCTLSSSIAANLALEKYTLEEAVALSIDYIHLGIDSMEKLGHGNGPLNHNVQPKRLYIEALANPISSENYAASVFEKYGSFYQFFVSHSRVANAWKRYINHPFLVALASNQLEFSLFIYYLKQDYHYLVNYAQMQCLTAAKAPDYKEIAKITKPVENIVQEIERHKVKMQGHGIDIERLDQSEEGFQPGVACEKYCSYLERVGKNDNFIASLVSLAPCLLGYYEAAQYGVKFRVENGTEASKIYGDWLAEYCLDWYSSAYHEGIANLDEYFKNHGISQTELEYLVEVFADVTLLEVEFWDEVMNL